MARMTIRLPKKLKKDAIVEAICELRFDCREAEEAPGIVVGVLSRDAFWTEFKKRSRPESELPNAIRAQNLALRFLPTVDFVDAHNARSIRIGERSLAIARSKPYPGWNTFFEDIRSATEVVFDSLSDVKVIRVGLRYVNAFSHSDHEIASVYDLNFSVTFADTNIRDEININFVRDLAEDIVATARIASPRFVNMRDKSSISGIVDIDVATNGAFSALDAVQCIKWIRKAHTEEKRLFFSFLSEEQLTNLVEEWE